MVSTTRCCGIRDYGCSACPKCPAITAEARQILHEFGVIVPAGDSSSKDKTK